MRKLTLKQLLSRCGTYATACHLRKRGYTLDQALSIIGAAKGGY